MERLWAAYHNRSITTRTPVSSPALRVALIVLVLLLVGLITPPMLQNYMSADNITRIFVAVCLLAPLGLVAGTAFPTGMKMAADRSRELTAWLWGINGAASVLSSVLAVLASINFGISASYYFATVWYGLAIWSALVWARAEKQS